MLVTCPSRASRWGRRYSHRLEKDETVTSTPIVQPTASSTRLQRGTAHGDPARTRGGRHRQDLLRRAADRPLEGPHRACDRGRPRRQRLPRQADQPAVPQDGVLAEESKDDLTRLRQRRVWIVDPLDGTAEFIAHNGEFVIMIGLAVDGEPVVGRGVSAHQRRALRGRARARARSSRSSASTGRSSVSDEARPRQVPARRQPVAPPALVDTMISEHGPAARAQHRQRRPEDRPDRPRPGRVLRPSQPRHEGMGHVRAGRHRLARRAAS